ncbi:hypothetical protein AaE_011129, partial [Aphanomyces astaci]
MAGWRAVVVGCLLAILALCAANDVATDGSTYYVSRAEKLSSADWRTNTEDVRVMSANAAADGTITWSDSLASGGTEIVGANVLDAAGNLYVVGSTKGNVTADTCNAGSFDLFLIKLSPTGARLWIAQIGTPQHDEARHVLLQTEADGSEYVYVCGVTFGALDEQLHATNG